MNPRIRCDGIPPSSSVCGINRAHFAIKKGPAIKNIQSKKPDLAKKGSGRNVIFFLSLLPCRKLKVGFDDVESPPQFKVAYYSIIRPFTP